MPASDPDEKVAYMTELRHRENTGERASVNFGPYTAVVLASVIRWTIDREMFAEHGEAMFQRLLDQLRLMFIEDVEHTHTIETGQHVDDRDLRRRELDGELATLKVGPFSAMILAGAVIWAARCRRLNPTEHDACAAVLKQLWPSITADPRGYAYIQQALTIHPT